MKSAACLATLSAQLRVFTACQKNPALTCHNNDALKYLLFAIRGS